MVSKSPQLGLFPFQMACFMAYGMVIFHCQATFIESIIGEEGKATKTHQKDKFENEHFIQ